ncbi:MAG: fatty acid--CoA ligase, partial [Gammaproteobacteria bacterium]|nr:fatty acid--CoA ligase [Gammaproteobacteria bacterium]
GLPDEQWGQKVTAFVCIKDAGATSEQLAEYVEASELSHYQRPREYRIVEELPKGPTGKLSRKLLRS